MKYMVKGLLAFMMIQSLLASADVAKLLNYQGRLTDAENKAVADDDYTVQFRLYISETEVNSVWNETQTITTKEGYFHTLLGQVNALTPTLFNQPLWLGIQVQGEAEMTPRQQLASSPAALTVADGAISNSKVAEGAISRENISQDLWMKIMPIGTILSWHPNIMNPPLSLPEEFVECNGQTLTGTGGPLDGMVVPDLNGMNRFLRGSDHSGDLQEDQAGSHTHNYTSAGFPEYGEGFAYGPYYKHRILSGTTDPNNPVGSETRPINMSVVWIMKIK